MIKANLVSIRNFIRNVVIVLLSVACVKGADVITLAIEHHIDDLLVEEGQYIDGTLYVWSPNCDIDDPMAFDFEGETEMNLELEEPGIYFFTAKTVLFNKDGSMVESSEESNSVEYEVIEQNQSADDPGDADPNEPSDPDDPNPDGESVVGSDHGGGSSCGCLISSLLVR